MVLVDDNPAFRNVLRRLLERQTDVTVVGEADNGIDAVELIERERPEVVVMDVSMPGLDGIAATARLAERAPEVRVILLSIGSKATEVSAGLQSGAAEYLVKGATADEIVDAIRRHGRGVG